MMDLTCYKAIIFDMDGTLIDSMGAHIKAWQMACESYGYPFDAEFMHSLGGIPTKQTVVLLNQKFGLHHSPDEVAVKKREFWLSLDESPSIIEQTCAVLKHYKGKLKIGVGTGAERPHALDMLEKTGLIEQIEALVTASDVYHGKPHPETFLSVAQLLNTKPSECVVFEDTEIGRQAALAANMDCILVKDGQIQIA
jgi:beta-phosphoglucomutase family hydrolase